MTVLFFAKSFYPNIGGVEKHVLEIGKIFVKKGFKVIVITENINVAQNKGYKSEVMKEKFVSEINGIKIIRINVGKEDKLKKFRIWFGLLKHINTIAKADIIHCHDIFFWYLPYRFLFPFKKVYTTFHGYEGNFIPTKKAILMHKIAEKLSWGNICVGDFLTKWYGTIPNYVTYGAVNTEIIEKGRRSALTTKDIIFIGRLEKETGVSEYLHAFYLLKQNNKNFKFDIFGDGSMREDIQNYIDENNLDVKIKGFISNVTDYIDDYKYVFVSRYLGILEAMALKKPIFAVYNNEIKKDYLKMATFSNYISISKNSKQIYNNFQKYLSHEGNIDVEKEYSWVKNQTWDKMVEIYYNLWNIKN